MEAGSLRPRREGALAGIGGAVGCIVLLYAGQPAAALVVGALGVVGLAAGVLHGSRVWSRGVRGMAIATALWLLGSAAIFLTAALGLAGIIGQRSVYASVLGLIGGAGGLAFGLVVLWVMISGRKPSDP